MSTSTKPSKIYQEVQEIMSTSSAANQVTESIDKAMVCARAAIDKKADRVKVLDLSELSGFTDFFVISSGSSDRQVQAIADSIEHEMALHGFRLVSNEGHGEGRWVLLDFGDVVVHIFLEALRDYYNLESLWAEAPQVKIPSEFYGPGASRLN